MRNIKQLLFALVAFGTLCSVEPVSAHRFNDIVTVTRSIDTAAPSQPQDEATTAAKAQQFAQIFGGYQGPIPPGYVSNFHLSNASKLKTVWPTRNPIISTQGDSTVEGVDETASPYNSQYPNAMPRQLATALTALGIPASSQNIYGVSGTTLTDYLNRQAWFTVSGSTILGSNKVQGGANITLQSPASGATFAFPGNVNTCEFLYGDGSAGRQFTYSIDGGSPQTITLSSTSQIAKQGPFSVGSLGAHSISFAWLSTGGVTINGVNCYNNADRHIDIWQQAASGFQSANIIDNGGAPGSGRLQQFQNWPPDVVIVEMGVNDWRNNVTVAQFKANILTFITSVRAMTGTPEVWLLMPPYDNSSLGNAANQGLYIQALYQLSSEQNCPMINLRQRWWSYSFAVSQGWQQPADSVHPTKAGAIDEAYSIIANVIQYVMQGSLSILLERDVYPSANDNNPIWKDKAA